MLVLLHMEDCGEEYIKINLNMANKPYLTKNTTDGLNKLIEKYGKIKIIVPIKNPIHRNFEHALYNLKDKFSTLVGVRRKNYRFINSLVSQKDCREYNKWIINNLTPLAKDDEGKLVFDRESGYSLVQTDKYELLVVRKEDFTKNSGIIRDFLELKTFMTNLYVGNLKPLHNAYHTFKTYLSPNFRDANTDLPVYSVFYKGDYVNKMGISYNFNRLNSSAKTELNYTKYLLGSSTCVIYFDPLFNGKLGHWKSILKNFRRYVTEKYDFYHIRNDNVNETCNLISSLDRLYKKVIFYGYVVSPISTIKPIINGCRRWSRTKLFINFLPLDEDRLEIAKSVDTLRFGVNLGPNFSLLCETDALVQMVKPKLNRYNVIKSHTPILPSEFPTNTREYNKNEVVIGYYFNKQDGTDLSKLFEAVSSRDNTVLKVKIRPDFKIINFFKRRYNKFLLDRKIQLCSRYLEGYAYYDFLNSLDIVIINYTSDPYIYRTSGVFLECLMLKKVVITKEGTSMAQVGSKYGCVKTFNKTVDSITQVVKDTLDNFDEDKKSVDRNYDEFMNEYRFSTIMDNLIEQNA